MNGIAAYHIDIYNLASKRYEYTFGGESAFFRNFEQSQLEAGSFEAKLTMDKSETMLQFQFIIDGTVQLLCDRSLEPFDFPLHTTRQLILKFGDVREELTDEIEIIPRDTHTINVAHYLYEFIMLALPMKKIHPSLAGKQYEEYEEGILVYRSLSAPEADELTKDDTDAATDGDPRWNVLKQLKDN